MITFREWIIDKLNLKEAMSGDDLVKMMQPILGAQSPDDFANKFYTMINPTYKAALAKTVQSTQPQQPKPTIPQTRPGPNMGTAPGAASGATASYGLR